MRRWPGLCAAALIALGSACPAATTRIEDLSLARPEGARHYLLATPDRPAAMRPLVIVLHGHGGSATQALGREHTAAPLALWLAIADREDLEIAAPDGVNGADGKSGWNDCRADAPNNPKTDDVGFIAEMIDREIAARRADPQRIYVIGMSNGGMMSFRLAIELGPRLAAFAAVGASMAAQTLCREPAHALPALIVSGTADPMVPYGGGQVRVVTRQARGGVIGVEAAVSRWRELARLPAAPTRSEAVPARDPSAPTRASRRLWNADPGALQIELIRIEGGGHAEPSIAQRYGRLWTMLVGAQNGDFETAEEAWAFFKDKRAAPPLSPAPRATGPSSPSSR